MKLNIFQKIAFLIYISIIVLICACFVPYQSNDNYTFHSSIMLDGHGTMSYFRFLIYLVIPTLSFYFIHKYLEEMNALEASIYKKRGKKELYVFFFFASIIIGSILFFYVKNEYSEIRKDRLKSQISAINYSFDKLRKQLSKRTPLDLSGAQDILKDSFDEYGIKIKKPTEKLDLDLSGYYETYKKKHRYYFK